jgi:hypothetical protein
MAQANNLIAQAAWDCHWGIRPSMLSGRYQQPDSGRVGRVEPI